MSLVDKEGREQLRTAVRLGAAGLELGVGIAVGYFLGSWADGHFGTTWIVWVGFGSGLVGGFWNLIQVSRTIQKRLNVQDEGDGDGRK